MAATTLGIEPDRRFELTSMDLHDSANIHTPLSLVLNEFAGGASHDTQQQQRHIMPALPTASVDFRVFEY